MFKGGRWRSERNKIKAVFRLEFHVTRVPKSQGDTLMLSLIPQDTGRPTLRLEKAIVKDGSCYWESPVYETIKFGHDPKTGKICERIYHLRVSTGLSKDSFGEVSMDFADYAEATNPSSVSFPLKKLNQDAVLHALIQKMPENVGQIHRRVVEDCEETKIKPRDRSLRAQLSFEDTDDSTTSNSTEDGSCYKPNLHNVEPIGSGSDVTISSSESSSGFNTPRELGPKDSVAHRDPTSFLLSSRKSPMPLKPVNSVTTPTFEERQKLEWEWSIGSARDLCIDGSIDNHPHDGLPKSEQALDVEIEKLMSDLLVLSRQAEVSELEIQTLRKQIVKEGKRGHELSSEVVSLKQERDAYKAECGKLKAVQNHSTEAKVRNKSTFEAGDPRAVLEELRQELNYEKDLNANLRLQLQKTQESNSELILAVQDLDEMLENKDREFSNICNKSAAGGESAGEMCGYRETISICTTDEDEDQKALEDLVKEHGKSQEGHLLEQQIIELRGEIEVYSRDKDELEMQMEQLALDYEILKQENHNISYKLEQSQAQEQLRIQYECSGSFATICELESQIESLEDKLKKGLKEFLDSLSTIKELEAHVKNLEEELEKQNQGFEADLESIMRAKVEQEQRAIKAEEELRLTRWRTANSAERLQEEFKRLSTQMASTFDENEKVAKKALAEASKLCLQKSRLEEMLHKANEDIESARDCYEEKLLELSHQIKLKTTQMEHMMLEIEDNSKKLVHQKKPEEEVYKELSLEIQICRSEIERLQIDNGKLSEQAEEGKTLRAELERMKTSMRETETLLQRGHVEKTELGNLLALSKTELGMLEEELSSMRSVKDEKERLVAIRQSELEMLRARYEDLKNSMFEDEVEKKKLRKQVSQLKADLKKEDAFKGIEKKLNDSNGWAIVPDGTKATPRSNNKSVPSPLGAKEVANLRERIKLLEGHVKQKEDALETSTNAFLEKEKDLHNKVEELENRVEELSCTANLNEHKVTRHSTAGINLNDVTPEEGDNLRMSEENEIDRSVVVSGDLISAEGSKASIIKTKTQGNLDELLTEVALLKEKNKLRDDELKEMQERYSEISLKFAEVEGERQMLVMTVRNLKNATKS